MSDRSAWPKRQATPAPATEPTASWPAGCIAPEQRVGYWLTDFMAERWARAIAATRLREELAVLEEALRRRYASTAEWRKVNAQQLAALRERISEARARCHCQC